METSENTLQKTALQAAGIIAAVMISIQLLVFVANPKGILPGMIVGLISFVLFISGLVIYGKKYRAERPDGLISYSDMLIFLLVVSGFYAGIMIVYSVLYFKVIDPNFAQKAIENTEEMFDKFNVPTSAREEALEKAKASFTFGKVMLNAVYSNLGLGIVVSLIVAAFLKKKDKSMDSLMKELE